MTIYVDSASLDDVTAAASLGFVGGFTTNPALMAGETAEPLKHFALLLAPSPADRRSTSRRAPRSPR